MRHMRKLTLLVVTTAAAIALSASSASAHISITDEANGGADCDPCFVSLDSVGNAESFTGTRITLIFMGMPLVLGTCVDELDLEVYEDGTGHITNQRLHGGSSCARRPCNSTGPETGDGSEWPFEAYETEFGDFLAEMTLCITLGGGTLTCHLDGISGNENIHTYQLNVHEAPCEAPNSNIRVTASWQATPGVEVDHGQ